jgi:Domain of unknown function (DUF1707)
MTDAAKPTLPAACGPIRISQAEREATVARLHRALQEGRLELSEVEERTTAAYASRHQSDLAMLVADLPPAPPSGWRQVGRAVIVQTWMSTSRLRGGGPAQPSHSQQRAVAAVLIAAALWSVVCLLAGFDAGLVG